MNQAIGQLNTIAFNILFQGNFSSTQMIITNQLQKASIPIQQFELFESFKTTSLIKENLLILSFVGVIKQNMLSVDEINNIKTIISQYVLPNLGCNGMPSIDILPAGRQFEANQVSLVSTSMFLKTQCKPTIDKAEAIQIAKTALSRIGYNQSVNCLPVQNGLMVTLLYDLPGGKITEIEKLLVDSMEIFLPYIGNYEISWKSSGFSVNL
jgi:hypothetical protein